MSATPPLPVHLEDLIVTVRRGFDSPLDQLSSAVVASEYLGDVADDLVGHFVEKARRSGASWSQIGQSMGVTKQAAQKRFVTKAPAETPAVDPAKGFSQFSADARDALAAAQEEARAAGNGETVPGHLVLGFLSLPAATATRALHAAADDAAIREALAPTLPAPAESVPALIPYDAGARQALEGTFAHAQRLGHPLVGTAHVLLALLEDAAVGPVLGELGIAPQQVEEAAVDSVDAHTRAASDG